MALVYHKYRPNKSNLFPYFHLPKLTGHGWQRQSLSITTFSPDTPIYSVTKLSIHLSRQAEAGSTAHHTPKISMLRAYMRRVEQINKFTFDIYCIRFDFADSMKARSLDFNADFCAGIEPTKVNENSSAYLLSDPLSSDDIPKSIASSIIAASVRRVFAVDVMLYAIATPHHWFQFDCGTYSNIKIDDSEIGLCVYYYCMWWQNTNRCRGKRSRKKWMHTKSARTKPHPQLITSHHLSSESGILHWCARVCTMICGINYNLIVRRFNERMNRMQRIIFHIDHEPCRTLSIQQNYVSKSTAFVVVISLVPCLSARNSNETRGEINCQKYLQFWVFVCGCAIIIKPYKRWSTDTSMGVVVA